MCNRPYYEGSFRLHSAMTILLRLLWWGESLRAAREDAPYGGGSMPCLLPILRRNFFARFAPRHLKSNEKGHYWPQGFWKRKRREIIYDFSLQSFKIWFSKSRSLSPFPTVSLSPTTLSTLSCRRMTVLRTFMIRYVVCGDFIMPHRTHIGYVCQFTIANIPGGCQFYMSCSWSGGWLQNATHCTVVHMHVNL